MYIISFEMIYSYLRYVLKAVTLVTVSCQHHRQAAASLPLPHI